MSRLPVPGSDDGTWGNVLNDFLSVAHNSDGTLQDAATIAGALQKSTVDAKGDLLVGTANDTVARVAVGSDGQVLTASSAQASGVAWSAPSTLSRPVYPLAAYGFFTASANLDACQTSSTLNTAFFARVFVPAGNAINAVGAIVHTAGTVGAGGLNGFAIYTDAGVLVASTANDDSQWQTPGWLVKTLGSPIAAQGADRFVYVGISNQGYSADPSVVYCVTEDAITAGGGYLVSNRRCFYNGISSWPASFNPASYGNSPGGYLPFVALG